MAFGTFVGTFTLIAWSMQTAKELNVVALGTWYGFLAAYAAKTSYDFGKKRDSDAEAIIAKRMAENTTPPATVQITRGDGDVSTVTTKPSLGLPPNVSGGLAPRGEAG